MVGGGSEANDSVSLSCTRCGKPANLHSQDCFKESWSSHKAAHINKSSSTEDEKKLASENESWLYCLKKGQARTLKLPHFNWTGTLKPFPISSNRTLPDHIDLPDWALDGTPKVEPYSDLQHTVEIKTPEQIERMRETCRIGREVLDAAARIIRPGITTDEIDRVVHEATVSAGAYPSPLNYHFFPKSCCTSVNEVICHGIPDSRKLEDGDIVNVDVTVCYKGVHGDLNETYFVGNVDETSRKLVQCTYECLEKVISVAKPGMRFREIGEIISRHASMSGFSVVKSYCGHGIGELFHCAPNIPHYSSILYYYHLSLCPRTTLSLHYNMITFFLLNSFIYFCPLESSLETVNSLTRAGNKAVGVMKVGQTFTIEPMINAGVWRDIMWPDGWTAVTADGKRSAQFEHTLLVTENGVDVLTGRLPTSPKVFPWLNE
ncbi:LOW QUALITY PROTEIN: hypothetical protein V2J09_017917 [Rumex salicifolius]